MKYLVGGFFLLAGGMAVSFITAVLVGHMAAINEAAEDLDRFVRQTIPPTPDPDWANQLLDEIHNLPEYAR